MDEFLKYLEECGFKRETQDFVSAATKMFGGKNKEGTDFIVTECLLLQLDKNEKMQKKFTELVIGDIVKRLDVKPDDDYKLTESDKMCGTLAMLKYLIRD